MKRLLARRTCFFHYPGHRAPIEYATIVSSLPYQYQGIHMHLQQSGVPVLCNKQRPHKLTDVLAAACVCLKTCLVSRKHHHASTSGSVHVNTLSTSTPKGRCANARVDNEHQGGTNVLILTGHCHGVPPDRPPRAAATSLSATIGRRRQQNQRRQQGQQEVR